MPPPPNSVHRPPGRASQRAMLAIGVAAYAFMLFGGLVVLAFGVVRGVNAARLAGRTSVATGTIIDRTASDATLWYSFSVPSRPTVIVGDAPVSTDEWARVEVGDPVEVDYLPDDPDTNWLAGHSPVDGEVLASVFGLAMGVFVLVVTQWRFGPRGLSVFRRRFRHAQEPGSSRSG